MLVLEERQIQQREQATITVLREYFTLGGCAGPEIQIQQREQATITVLREYFTLGGCAGPERRTSHNNSFSGNISLWEDVVVLKGPSFVVLGAADTA